VIVSIAGISASPLNRGDLSTKLERGGDGQDFNVEAQLGSRMDLCTFTLMDEIPGVLAIPDRAEVVIYDAAAGADVTDPPNAISAYNTFRNGAGTEHTSVTAANWTPRLFAGYVATPKYTAEGPQRYVEISAQDYTFRLRTTVVNQAFSAGQTDQSIIQTLGQRYRSDFDYSNVMVVTSNFPAISFPVHTFEQFLQRIVKITRAVYRVDYFKRMFYGLAGQLMAPINFSDRPAPNLVLNGDFADITGVGGVSPYSQANIAPSYDVASGPPVGARAYKLQHVAAGDAYFFMTLPGVTGAVANGRKFTLSFWAKADVASVLYANAPALQDNISNHYLAPDGAPTLNIGVNWARYTMTWTVGAAFFTAIEGVHLVLRPLTDLASNNVYYAGVQLELGSVASAIFSPNLSFPTEGLEYTPDGSGLVNKVWVIGDTFLSNQQAYTIPPSLINSSNFQFPLPGDPEPIGMSVTVAGVDQGIVGVAPGDGDVTTPSSLKYNTAIQHTPSTITFKTPPTTGQTVIVTGKFRYPLVQTISDPALIAASGGLIFEGVLRDKRIDDFQLARSVGQSYLQNQGQALKGGQLTSKYRANPITNAILQPGQVVSIKNDVVFQGLLKDAGGGPTTIAVVVITKLETSLTDDVSQPYETTVSFADRTVFGGY
jgi:hypothetical protein